MKGAHCSTTSIVAYIPGSGASCQWGVSEITAASFVNVPSGRSYASASVAWSMYMCVPTGNAAAKLPCRASFV